MLWTWIGVVPSVAPSISSVAEASGSIRGVVVPALRLKKLHDKGGSSAVGNHKPNKKSDVFITEVR